MPGTVLNANETLVEKKRLSALNLDPKGLHEHKSNDQKS